MEIRSSPMEWAEAQFKDCVLGDKRRVKRLIRVGSSMIVRSGASIPKQMGNWAEIKGAYRLFEMEEVTHKAISRPHWLATRELARSPDQGLVLFVQDQTELNYGFKPDSYGLGFVADTLGRGIEVQTTLGILPSASDDERAEVLGVALQTPWLRTHAPRKKIETGKQRSSRHTEYDVWGESVDEIGPAPAPESGTTWVSVGDRASDVFKHLWTAHQLGWRCLIRSKHNRKLKDAPPGEVCKLHEKARSLEPAGSTSISLRARPGQAARTVNLDLAYFSALLPGTAKSGKRGSLEVTCVRVWEDPSICPVKEPIEWLLLTTLPVESLADALKVIHLYRHRWLVEEYHKCLKTGCKIEARHLTHADKLLPLLGLLSVVAAFLLQFKTPNDRVKPPDLLVAVVKQVTQAKEDLTKPKAFLRRLAMMGGFIGRKSDGEPGWQTIWEGWNRLRDILIGIEIAEAVRCG